MSLDNYFGFAENVDAAVYRSAKNIHNARKIKCGFVACLEVFCLFAATYGGFQGIIKILMPDKITASWTDILIVSAFAGFAMMATIFGFMWTKHKVSLDPKYDWAEEYLEFKAAEESD